MRIIYLSLCICFLMLLCGCAAPPVADATVFEETAPDTTLPETTESTTEETVPENRDTVIDTKYFSVTIPESWGEYYSYEIFNYEESAYSLIFYETQSREEYGGKVFSIRLIPETEDYTYYPSYEVLGRIETNQSDTFNVIVLYPTDVQFNPDHAQIYAILEAGIDDILESITYHDCTFSH